MARIKLTTLTDKASDEEILNRLKSIGVKIKDKNDKEEALPERKGEEKATQEGVFVEKRVASTIIRRRAKAGIETPKTAHEKPESPKKKSEVLTKKEAEVIPQEEKTRKEGGGYPEVRIEPLSEAPVEKKEIKAVADEVDKGPGSKEDRSEAIKMEEIPAEEHDERPKGDLELIAEEKKREITKVLEEAYKHELESGIDLGVEKEEGEGKQKKKVEKLIKRIEEQEFEEQKSKKKTLLKRKVVIKDEDIHPFKRHKPKVIPLKKEKRERQEEKGPEPKTAKKVIKLGDEVQVDTLAKRMGVKAQELISKLLSLGVIASINHSIDFDTAYLVAFEFGYEVEKTLSIEEEFFAMEEEKESPENLKPRPPVVTIMGHVDHGKTLLLDTIRHTKVVEKEAGGITQHIGAYKVDVNDKEVVFIDTPGHEAFTAMRARGAKVTDIVVLVVAADDGVMPQTREAIDHAKAANVPIIVAINKIDKPNANPERVMKDLSELGLIPEEWGGTALYAKISAKKRIGIEELLNLIILQAEMLELKANPDKGAKGIIIESGLDKGHGPVGTVIIQEGTLKMQDPFVAGTMFGRVRAMIDDKGQRLKVAPPSTPVLVVGFQDVPHAGDRFIVTTEESYAKELSRYRQDRLREEGTQKSPRATLEELYSKMDSSDKKVLNLIVKGDARGTIDAITDTLNKMSGDVVEIKIIHSGVGAITETDVSLAMASDAIIIGFNTKPLAKAQSIAEKEKIEIRTYAVIYEMIDDIKRAMEGMLAPKIVETIIGKAEVRKVFAVSRIGSIGGCYVLEGKVTRNSLVKVIREAEVIWQGKLASLKRFKDDVKEVSAGYECGISIENFNDIKEGDILEFSIEEKERQTSGG